MSYSFSPMTEEELNVSELLENGEYEFEVVKSTRKVSKAGNPMAELQIKIWDKQGGEHFIFDYLVFSTVNLNIKKIKHFCDAVGLEKQYLQGQIPEDLARYVGKLDLGTQEQQVNPNGGFYPKKNIVIDYIERPKDGASDSFIDSDLPF